MRDKVKLVCLLLGALLVAGCATDRGEGELPFRDAPQFSPAGGESMPDRWWTSFGSGRLDSLVEEALQGNFTLKSAMARLAEARAIARRHYSDLYPELDAGASAETVAGDSSEGDQFQFELAASYEVDLWGRIRAGAEAERYRAERARFDYQSAAISLSAEISNVWLRLMEVYNRLQILDAQVETNTKMLRLLEKRLANGTARSVDVMRQRQLLEATRQQRVVGETEAGVLEHQIAVLLGMPPQGGLKLEKSPLPELPRLPETGLPGQLIRRRPDVRSEYSRLMAADREVAVAISERYPRIDLSVSLVTEGESADLLFDEWVRSFAASIAGPLLDGGERRAEVERAKAVRDQRIYAYGQAVLTAFQEVEDALLNEKRQHEKVGIIENRLNLAVRTKSQLRLEYSNGAADFLDFLNAQDEEQQLRRELLVAQRDLLAFRIALYRALAGGFELDSMKGKKGS